MVFGGYSVFFFSLGFEGWRKELLRPFERQREMEMEKVLYVCTLSNIPHIMSHIFLKITSLFAVEIDTQIERPHSFPLYFKYADMTCLKNISGPLIV